MWMWLMVESNPKERRYSLFMMGGIGIGIGESECAGDEQLREKHSDLPL